MSKYIFTKIPDAQNEYDRTRIEFVAEADTITDLLEVVEDFLRGCGFHVDAGSIQIVGKEENDLGN